MTQEKLEYWHEKLWELARDMKTSPVDPLQRVIWTTLLEALATADKRQTVTSSILLPFAMFQDGTKLTKRLNDQRRYLRGVFDDPY